MGRKCFNNVVVFSFMHLAHGIEDTNTLGYMYVFIYLLLATHRHGGTRRYPCAIKILTSGRKKKV